jgi:two-component system, NtrC family, sensor kinase
VTAPVRALHHAAQALGAADYQRAVASLPAPRGDEIGTLRDAFEEMARLLREREVRLQDRVGLSEAELQKADARLKRTIAAAARSEHLAALGRLASGVAHEIRTPLTSLKLYLQSVQDEFTISAEHAEDFEIAMRQVTRIATTINHFLNFARPQDPILGVLDFRQLVEESLIVVRPRANHQSVEVKTSVAPHLPRVEGDARQLGEALVNLTVNALEAMPQGGHLRITVTAEPSSPADRATPGVRIDVADNGQGIREQDRALLFEPFFTTKATGSGLGLAIVHGTVERHGGILRVQTEVGSGTTFSIFLPATAEPNHHGQSPDRG